MTQQVIATVDRHVRIGVQRRPPAGRPVTPRGGTVPRLSRSGQIRVPVDRSEAAGCWVDRPAGRSTGSVNVARPGVMRQGASVETRLTDRGIAVVLTLGAMLVLAALVCIGTTAVRVTAEPTPRQVDAMLSAPIAGGVVGVIGSAR